MGALVVGVDGSAGSRVAARFALEEARFRETGLRLVSVWHVPLAAYGGPPAPPPAAGLRDDLKRLAETALEETITALGDTGGIEIEQVVREGHPAQALVEEAAGADLLIVGSRGYGGFRGLLLGSVSQQCAHHAPCPIVIVPQQAPSS